MTETPPRLPSHILPEHDIRPYSVAQLADRWGCSGSMIYRLISDGELQCFRIGVLIRVPAAEVARYEARADQANATILAAPVRDSPTGDRLDGERSIKRRIPRARRRTAPIVIPKPLRDA